MNNSHFKPIDRTAANVISVGVHHDVEVKIKLGYYHQIVNPKIWDNNDEFIDYTGIKIGKLTILGRRKRSKSELKSYSNSSWIVRCECGILERKSQQKIKRYLDRCESQRKNAMCAECKDLFDSQINDKRKAYGIRDEFSDDYKNFIGKKFGSFIVISPTEAMYNYLDRPIEISQWNVKCNCGNFDKKSYQKLTNKDFSRHLMCRECNQLDHIKRKEYFSINGCYPDDSVSMI